MPDELLPPDPSKDGWYWWLRAPNGLVVPAQWRGYGWKVFGQPVAYGAQFMADQGYTLASPHPIPGPEQLDALWRVMKWLGQPAYCPSAAERYRQAGREHVHEMLRAALGAEPAPNDPPGNVLDDVRATAMDQWDVPRAGEETAP